MEILQSLITFDKWLFECINTGMSNPLFDALLPLCREKWFWAPFYLFILSFCLLNFGKKGWIIILGLVISAGLSDFTSSTIIKKNVQRIRPCNSLEMNGHIQHRVSCGGGYSFTSSHAANHFAVAVFLIGALGLAGRWQQKAILFWAALVAFSQVYVGVHYPFDVVGGALLGSLIGWWTLFTLKRLVRLPLLFSRQYP